MITDRVLNPQDFGFDPIDRTAIVGASAAENAARFRKVMQGRESELCRWICVNAAPAFYLSERTATLRDGAQMALSVIASGSLKRFVNDLVESSLERP